MECPNCKIEMNNGICLKCGYMENGNYIKEYSDSDKYADIRIYNDDFDQMNSNSKKYLNFLLGPFYFSYRNHLFLGFVVGIIAYIVFYLEMLLMSSLNSMGNIFCLIAYFNVVIYVVINRFLYMGFSNVICIYIDKLNVKRIKKRSNYINLLQKHKSSSIAKLIIHILLHFVIIVFVMYLRG